MKKYSYEFKARAVEKALGRAPAPWPAAWRMCVLAESNNASPSSVRHGNIVAIADHDRFSDLNKRQE